MRAFQQNAFQDNAFQMGGVIPPPTPGGGGGGGGGWTPRDESGFKKRNFIRRELERAIKQALNPPSDEPNRPVKLWTRPQRAKVFPNYWKELQISALMNVELENLALALAPIVAQQKMLFEDDQAARAVLDLMMRDLL